MKLVIEIPDYLLEHAKNMSEDSNDEWTAMRAIANGLPYEQRPHGEWVRKGNDFFCSVCNTKAQAIGYIEFCGRCGADMRTPCQKCEYGYLEECDITCDMRKEGCEK